nr:hypothetical protein 1 [Desulfobacterales bacterium]
MKKAMVIMCSAAFLIGFVVKADAALIDRGGGLIYSEYLDVTFLQDTNYAFSSGYAEDNTVAMDGQLQWQEALDWVDALEYEDTVRGITWKDWRLPSALNFDGSGPDAWEAHGYEITTELSYLRYVELDGLALDQCDTCETATIGLFINLNPDSPVFWYSTEYDTDNAWWFSFENGEQDIQHKENSIYALAVRDGDVAAPVPEPTTILLFGTGLLGLIGSRKLRG